MCSTVNTRWRSRAAKRFIYYGGPGLRYFRAAEHFIFGDGFLGYLSLTLLLPFMVFAAFRRFLGARAALALVLVFIAIPIGALFGSTFYQYAKWAARGFADPAAATLFLAGFVALIGPTAAGPNSRFAPAFGAGLLFALALWVRPNLAPGAGVLLGGAGFAALWQVQLWRVAGLCLGFLPVFGMALHNWVFGGVFVLFSAQHYGAGQFSDATIGLCCCTWRSRAAGFRCRQRRSRADPTGGTARRPFRSLRLQRLSAQPPLPSCCWSCFVEAATTGGCDWLAQRRSLCSALRCSILRLDRYHYLAWFLTLLVCAVWMRDEGVDLLKRWFPRPLVWLASHPALVAGSRVLDWWAGVTGIAGPAARR